MPFSLFYIKLKYNSFSKHFSQAICEISPKKKLQWGQNNNLEVLDFKVILNYALNSWFLFSLEFYKSAVICQHMPTNS